MATQTTIPKRNWEYWPWKIAFWGFILYSTIKWLLPVIGNNCSESLNRLGLFLQITGLASLIPEFVDLEEKVWVDRKEKLLIATHTFWNDLAEYQEFFNKTIFETGRSRGANILHIIFKSMFSTVFIIGWIYKQQGFLIINSSIDLFIPPIGLTCSIWLVLGVIRLIITQFRKKLYPLLNLLYNVSDGLLYIPIFLPVALLMSLVYFLVSNTLISFDMALPVLIKKRTLPPIAIGTLLEFVATFPLNWCSF